MRLRILLVLLLIPLATAEAVAQEPPLPTPADTLLPVADTIPREAASPRAAFIRALVLPELGHFPIGEYRRGAVFFTLQTASWAMLVKTIMGLGDARDADRALTQIARDSLELVLAEDTALANRLRDDPIAYEQALLTYPDLALTRALVTSRERHRQDWIVYTVVTTFAAAIDAYVAAHLRDFPAEVTTGRSRDGATTVGLRVPVGGRR
jgi:hypothetical protein